jgi:hypothetical protein
MIPKKPAPDLIRGGHRFPACAKPRHDLIVRTNASAGVGRSDKIMPNQKDDPQCSIVVLVILELDLVEPCLLEYMGAILAEILRIPHAGDALGVLDLDDGHQRAAGFELYGFAGQE